MQKKAFVFLAEGFEEIEALTPIDILRRAGVHVIVVSVTTSKNVAGAHAITVAADCLFDEISGDTADLILLPGGMPGTSNLNSHAGLKHLILSHYRNNKTIAAICAAPIILGEMGLLKGHTATCYPGNEKRLEGAVVSSRPVEVSLPFITGKGVGAAIEFSLALVEHLFDAHTAQELGKRMVVA